MFGYLRSQFGVWQLLKQAAVWLLAGVFLVCSMPLPSLATNIPQPSSPEDGTQTTSQNFPPLGIPSFEWSQVSGASLYRIEVSQNQNFSPPVFSTITAYTRYTPILDTANTWCQ